jgi:hypothetical protein
MCFDLTVLWFERPDRICVTRIVYHFTNEHLIYLRHYHITSYVLWYIWKNTAA